MFVLLSFRFVFFVAFRVVYAFSGYGSVFVNFFFCVLYFIVLMYVKYLFVSFKFFCVSVCNFVIIVCLFAFASSS